MLAFLQPGRAEGFKGGYHAVLGLLLAGAAGYNALAFAKRAESHLLVNAIGYGVLAWWEVGIVQHHREQSLCGRS